MAVCLGAGVGAGWGRGGAAGRVCVIIDVPGSGWAAIGGRDFFSRGCPLPRTPGSRGRGWLTWLPGFTN